MICIHGLSEINCPNCRIIKSTLPKKSLNINKNTFLKIENPLFRKHYSNSRMILEDIIPKKVNFHSKPINLISKPNLINKNPQFKNEMFLERLTELDLAKSDQFGISKKISLESPEWKYKKE